MNRRRSAVIVVQALEDNIRRHARRETGGHGRVAEWQTRWLQVPVSFGTWGFKSPFAHRECKHTGRDRIADKRSGLFRLAPAGVAGRRGIVRRRLIGGRPDRMPGRDLLVCRLLVAVAGFSTSSPLLPALEERNTGEPARSRARPLRLPTPMPHSPLLVGVLIGLGEDQVLRGCLLIDVAFARRAQDRDVSPHLDRALVRGPVAPGGGGLAPCGRGVRAAGRWRWCCPSRPPWASGTPRPSPGSRPGRRSSGRRRSRGNRPARLR